MSKGEIIKSIFVHAKRVEYFVDHGDTEPFYEILDCFSFSLILIFLF